MISSYRKMHNFYINADHEEMFVSFSDLARMQGGTGGEKTRILFLIFIMIFVPLRARMYEGWIKVKRG